MIRKPTRSLQARSWNPYSTSVLTRSPLLVPEPLCHRLTAMAQGDRYLYTVFFEMRTSLSVVGVAWDFETNYILAAPDTQQVSALANVLPFKHIGSHGRRDGRTELPAAQCDVHCRPQEPRNPETQKPKNPNPSSLAGGPSWSDRANGDPVWKRTEHLPRPVQDQTGQARPVEQVAKCKCTRTLWHCAARL